MATRTDLASGQLFSSVLVEYKLAGEWFDAPKGEEGAPTTAQSLVASVLIRSRDLGQRAEGLRDSIAQDLAGIERLEAELAKPSAYSETLKRLNQRLEAVTTALLGKVEEENVIADSNEVQQADAESYAPSSVQGSREGPAEASEVTTAGRRPSGPNMDAVEFFNRQSNKFVQQYGPGIEPAKLDSIIAAKMAEAGWDRDAISNAVDHVSSEGERIHLAALGSNSGIRSEPEALAEGLKARAAYASKVADRAVAEAHKARKHTVDRRALQGVER